MSRRTTSRRRIAQRGSALLAVLWLSAAMTAIAFALSRGVRTELDRASLNVDSMRAYYLAQGAIEATMRRIVRPMGGPGEEPGFRIGLRRIVYEFASGTVDVEIVGESGKLDVNQARPEALARVFEAAGVEPAEAVVLAMGVVDYRDRLRRGEVSFGLSPAELAARFGNPLDESSFRAAAASIQELEELLAIPGMTAERFHGGYRETADGELVRFAGVRELLTVRGSAVVDISYAEPAMLAAAGMNLNQIAAVERIRQLRPLTPLDFDVRELGDPRGPIRLSVGGASTAYTLRATATLANGQARRTVAALIEQSAVAGPDPIRVVRWYDASL